MSSISNRPFIVLYALVITGVIGTPLSAAAAEKHATVSLADLDLSTTTGMQEARERLHQKARWLCSRVVDPWSLSHQPDFVHCVDDVTASATAKLQDKQLLVANAKSHAGSSSR